MFSGQEARHFLRKTLHLDSPGQPELPTLNLIIKKMHLKFPFQNISLLNKEIGTHDVPSREEIKNDMMRGVGGLCFTNNYFMYELLKALDFDVSLSGATCNLKHPDNHIVNIVRISGMPYLVDVGFGYPTLQAACLDFNEISQVYKDTFLSYRFRKCENSSYEREHLQDFPTDFDTCTKSYSQPITWQRVYSFDLIKRDFDYFYPSMHEVYSDRFLKKFRLVLFTDKGMIAYREDKGSISKLILEDGHYRCEHFDKFALNQLSDDISNYCLYFDKESIERGIKYVNSLTRSKSD